MKITRAVVESYARHVATSVGLAVIVVTNLTHKGPFNFNLDDWKLVANSLWVSAIPQIRNYVQLKDPADAPIVNYALNEVSVALAPEPSPATLDEGVQPA